MVLRLACPHCGARPIEEWVYGETLDPLEYLMGRTSTAGS